MQPKFRTLPMIMGTEHKCLHKVDFNSHSFLFKSGAYTFMGGKLFICLTFTCLTLFLSNIFKGVFLCILSTY